MTTTTSSLQLTPALEDYLETIYALVREHKVARVRDIATARDVKAGSVSPAMRRLADLGLIRYVQREYIDLTPEGREQALRVMARHRILKRFFRDVLRMPSTAADAEACAVEHSLSNAAMDGLVRFFEYLQACPHGQADFLERFHSCTLVNSASHQCAGDCVQAPPGTAAEQTRTLFQLSPGESARVLRVDAAGPVRQRLLDMGLLPGALVEFERTAPSGDPIWIRLLGSHLALRQKEAEAIVVSAK